MAQDPDEKWAHARILVDAALAEMTVENVRSLVMELEQQLSQPGLDNVVQLDTGRASQSDS